MIGGRYIEFMGDNKIIDTQYLERPIISKYTKLIHSFEDSTKTEVYIYAGDERGGKLAEWFPQQVFTLDINDDKINDVIFPMSFGYASGLDGRTPFIALTTSNGTLEFNNEINAKMLYQVPTLIERAKIWYKETGYEIKVILGDLTNAEFMRSLFTGENVSFDWSLNNSYIETPDTVIHYAEQPSAPYSIMNYKTANFTIRNNLLVTNNLLFAIKDLSPNVHIIKLGTMGEYGTPNIDIEEG